MGAQAEASHEPEEEQSACPGRTKGVTKRGSQNYHGRFRAEKTNLSCKVAGRFQH